MTWFPGPVFYGREPDEERFPPALRPVDFSRKTKK